MLTHVVTAVAGLGHLHFCDADAPTDIGAGDVLGAALCHCDDLY